MSTPLLGTRLCILDLTKAPASDHRQRVEHDESMKLGSIVPASDSSAVKSSDEALAIMSERILAFIAIFFCYNSP
jgi:hypothetical protein